MTPFYFVVEAVQPGYETMMVRSVNLATKKQAIDLAKDITQRTGKITYVVEAIAKIELPKPEPIVTMKGD